MATKKKAAPTGKAGKKNLSGGSGDSPKASDLKGGGGSKGGGTKAAKKKK
ncbi:MAG: hypothetical protein NTY38_28480 [Acidobacteria bacterium]|nr:hypothetical protein [Acidobacteriota bacterium]